MPSDRRRFIVHVENTDGGSEPTLHFSFDAAKAAVRAWLTDPSNDPPLNAEELEDMEIDLARADPDHQSEICGSQAWKEVAYITPSDGESK